MCLNWFSNFSHLRNQIHIHIVCLFLYIYLSNTRWKIDITFLFECRKIIGAKFSFFSFKNMYMFLNDGKWWRYVGKEERRSEYMCEKCLFRSKGTPRQAAAWNERWKAWIPVRARQFAIEERMVTLGHENYSSCCDACFPWFRGILFRRRGKFSKSIFILSCRVFLFPYTRFLTSTILNGTNLDLISPLLSLMLISYLIALVFDSQRVVRYFVRINISILKEFANPW